MINNQKFSTRFWLYNQKQKDGKAPLYIRVYIDGARTEISTRYFIDPLHWDSKQSRIKAMAPESLFLNGFIDRSRNTLYQFFLDQVSRGKLTTPQELKNMFLGIEDTPKYKTILDAFDYHNLKMAEIVKVGKVMDKTLERYKFLQKKVETFTKYQYKTNDKALPEIRLAFVTEFEHYLLTIGELKTNTAHKYIKNLKKVMNMAVGLDWIPSNPFNQFKCSYISPEREILTQDELNTILNKDFGIDRMNEVRDVFIFCCYTGFAYADAYQFERNAITKGLDGNLWLCTNRQKTGTKESVPLLPIPLEIIEKYKNHAYCIKYNKLLPINSNQRYNAYLKELADLCMINKNLTTHIARHTFATTVTLANGVPIETVSRMLGHTSIKTTQIYAKVIEQKVSDDMNILRTKFLTISNQEEEKNLKIG